VLAKADRGNLVFDVQSIAKRKRDCLTRIAVFAEDSARLAMPEPGDDREAVEDGFYWRALSEREDQCIGSLPLRYGSRAKESAIVRPKPLRTGLIYVVALTEGSTGYRSGRFRITSDRRVENLPKELVMEPHAQ
jgi:hypothetical protein